MVGLPGRRVTFVPTGTVVVPLAAAAVEERVVSSPRFERTAGNVLSWKHIPWVAAAAAILIGAVVLVAGLAVGGNSVMPWVLTLVFLTCPLTMLFTMRWMYGSSGDT